MNEDNLGLLLHSVSSTIDEQANALLLERLDIGLAQYKVLAVLASGALPQRSIAASLGQTEASISRQINIMTDVNMVSRKISPHDRRQHVISLNAKGSKKLTQASQVLNNHFSRIFGGLSYNEQESLHKILQKMHLFTK